MVRLVYPEYTIRKIVQTHLSYNNFPTFYDKTILYFKGSEARTHDFKVAH